MFRARAHLSRRSRSPVLISLVLVFLGFLPSKAGERSVGFIEGLGERTQTYAAYESPKRLIKTLTDIYDILGDIEVVVAREMTKLHEEVQFAVVSQRSEKILKSVAQS